jgi:Ni/Co efflux regulator RcnB
MKRLLPIALALSFLAPAAALAQPENHGGPPGMEHEHGSDNHGGEREAPHASPGHHEAMKSHRDWHRGDRFEGHRYVLDWKRHHLRQPPRGYQWVHDGDQYVMIAIASGVIADVILHAH